LENFEAKDGDDDAQSRLGNSKKSNETSG